MQTGRRVDESTKKGGMLFDSLRPASNGIDVPGPSASRAIRKWSGAFCVSMCEPSELKLSKGPQLLKKSGSSFHLPRSFANIEAMPRQKCCNLCTSYLPVKCWRRNMLDFLNND